MSEFTEEIAEARSLADPNGYIDRVKTAVRREFGRIDKSADLEDTHYFNHSAVPDFVIRWPDREERRLYLRSSFQSIVAGSDAIRFNSAQPMLLALNGSDSLPVSETGIYAQSTDAPDTLISDSETLEILADYAMITTDAEADVSPVSELIRTNFARGARGLITPIEATDLLSIGSVGNEKNTDATLLIDRLSKNFLPQSIAKIARTVDLVELSQLSPDIEYMFPAEGQRLSRVELESVLPWILRNTSEDSYPGFWKYLGSMFDFADLFEIKESLIGMDLTQIVKANISSWSGKRAYIGAQNIATHNATDSEISIREDGVWSLIGSTVGVNFSGSRLHVSPTGSAIRGRDGVSSALWADLSSALDGFQVDSIGLRGIDRSIAVTAEESADVSMDVEEITATVDDTYYVRQLGLRVPVVQGDEVTAANVSFDSRIVATERPIALSTLATVALRVLLYLEPVPENVIASLLGGGPELKYISGPHFVDSGDVSNDHRALPPAPNPDSDSNGNASSEDER